MSSTKSNSTEPGAGNAKPGPWRGAVAQLVVTIALLAVLVWAMSPSSPHLTPAPLRPDAPGCAKGPPEFTPTNLTEIPDPPLDALEAKGKNRVLLRLNMEPCSCGCGLSLASCRVSSPGCETSRTAGKKIVSEETDEKH